MKDSVYFIAMNDALGAIKIGRAAEPLSRLHEINIWLPYDLTLLATVPDGSLERNIQDCFADAHIRGEWFMPIPRLLKAIEDLKAGVPVHEAIDLSKRLGNTLGMTQRATMARNGTATAAQRRERRAALQQASAA
jgi:hypothetical protein